MSDETATTDPAAHVPRQHLFALLYAKRDELPTSAGPDVDGERLRLRNDLADAERYQQPLAPELQLGPDTADRYWEHAWSCEACRCLLLEDGPGARPAKTQSEVAAEAAAAEEQREKLVRKFGFDAVIGGGFFVGAVVVRNVIAAKKPEEIEGPQLQSAKKMPIDPMWFVFMAFLLIASWFLAEAYTIARELWIDYTAFKRAVPIIGKRWAAKGKPGGGADEPGDS